MARRPVMFFSTFWWYRCYLAACTNVICNLQLTVTNNTKYFRPIFSLKDSYLLITWSIKLRILVSKVFFCKLHSSKCFFNHRLNLFMCVNLVISSKMVLKYVWNVSHIRHHLHIIYKKKPFSFSLCSGMLFHFFK